MPLIFAFRYAAAAAAYAAIMSLLPLMTPPIGIDAIIARRQACYAPP